MPDQRLVLCIADESHIEEMFVQQLVPSDVILEPVLVPMAVDQVLQPCCPRIVTSSYAV